MRHPLYFTTLPNNDSRACSAGGLNGFPWRLASPDSTVFLCFPPVISLILLACSLGMYADGIQCFRNYSFCWRFSLNNWCWGKNFCIKIYWTQAKMLLLADVDENSFENAGICIIDILTYSWIQSPICDFICTTSAGLFVAIMTYF